MAEDATPTGLPPRGELAPPEAPELAQEREQPRSLRPILIAAAVLLLSLWFVGEAWAHTFGASLGGCGGG
jgi:hypothetical protein